MSHTLFKKADEKINWKHFQQNNYNEKMLILEDMFQISKC